MRTFLLLLCFALPAQADMKAAQDALNQNQFEKAAELFIPIANAGSAEAEYLLGTIYKLGLQVSQDNMRAFDFFLRAASKGHPAAQLRVSQAYLSGEGTKQDPTRAYVWAELAKIGGAQGANEQVTHTQSGLTDEALKQANVLIQDYRPYLYPLEQQ